MRTTGHIVRKDVRRLAIPVAVWLAFQAGALVWFAQAPGFLAHDVATWVYGYGLWAELIHRRAPWKTKEAVELATLEWVSWFNHRRLLEPIGHVPPAELEEAYYRQLAESATSA